MINFVFRGTVQLTTGNSKRRKTGALPFLFHFLECNTYTLVFFCAQQKPFAVTVVSKLILPNLILQFIVPIAYIASRRAYNYHERPNIARQIQKITQNSSHIAAVVNHRQSKTALPFKTINIKKIGLIVTKIK